MKRRRNNKKGVAMVELAMVMLLLTLFGITIFTLIITGADTQSRIITEKDRQTDARIALSYVNVRLRQNDMEGKIGVEPIALTGRNGIVLRERDVWDPDFDHDTWIYSYDGKLYECLVNPGQEPEESLSIYITDIGRLETELQADGTIANTVFYEYDGKEEQLSSLYYPRTGIGAAPSEYSLFEGDF